MAEERRKVKEKRAFGERYYITLTHAGALIVVERTGDVVTIRPKRDAAEEKRKVLELVDALRALPKPPYVEKREPIEFPDRPGLY